MGSRPDRGGRRLRRRRRGRAGRGGGRARAGIDAIVRLGGAEPGDKTMVDAALPFRETLLAEFEASADLAGATRAAAVARDAAEATADITARLGRAKVLGDKSVGPPDPGAVSFALLMAALGEHFAQGPGVQAPALGAVGSGRDSVDRHELEDDQDPRRGRRLGPGPGRGPGRARARRRAALRDPPGHGHRHGRRESWRPSRGCGWAAETRTGPTPGPGPGRSRCPRSPTPGPGSWRSATPSAASTSARPTRRPSGPRSPRPWPTDWSRCCASASPPR